MNAVPSSMSSPGYGIDAPPIVRAHILIGGGGVVLIALAVRLRSHWPRAARLVRALGWCIAVYGLSQAGLLLWSSTRGKPRVLQQLVADLKLRGDERVLDAGCGRGMLLVALAKGLPRGQAVGIDLWRREDQSGNDPSATRANAEAEGVGDRVEVRSGDMRQLPFDAAYFDVVASSMAIHNIEDRHARVGAINEIARVVKPGGRVALLDFLHTDEYARILSDLGWHHVQRSTLNPHMWPPVRIVTGRKPGL